MLFLAPECMQKAFNVQDQWRTLAFVIQHPLGIAPTMPGLLCGQAHGMLSLHRDSFGCPFFFV